MDKNKDMKKIAEKIFEKLSENYMCELDMK